MANKFQGVIRYWQSEPVEVTYFFFFTEHQKPLYDALKNIGNREENVSVTGTYWGLEPQSKRDLVFVVNTEDARMSAERALKLVRRQERRR